MNLTPEQFIRRGEYIDIIIDNKVALSNDPQFDGVKFDEGLKMWTGEQFKQAIYNGVLPKITGGSVETETHESLPEYFEGASDETWPLVKHTFKLNTRGMAIVKINYE